MAEPLTIPGFVNAHSHAFQRALRGQAAGDDFWGWRDAMLAEAERQTPETVRAEYAETYREMRAAGYTAVGEFHYLGREEGTAAVEAAKDAGIELILLLAAYARGGLERFRQASVAEYLQQLEDFAGAGVRVAVAPHSIRACPPDWLAELGAYAEREGLPLHVHASEQRREVDSCYSQYGYGPIQLLAEHGCLGPRTTIVHATHAYDEELDLIAEAGARVCLCPTTEASLGDGFAPVERLCERGIGICIGSDSNVRIDPLEELREIEGIARRMAERRNVLSAERLLCYGSDEGAGAIGVEHWGDVDVDLDHPSLRGVDDGDVFEALVWSCGADVLSPAS